MGVGHFNDAGFGLAADVRDDPVGGGAVSIRPVAERREGAGLEESSTASAVRPRTVSNCCSRISNCAHAVRCSTGLPIAISRVRKRNSARMTTGSTFVRNPKIEGERRKMAPIAPKGHAVTRPPNRTACSLPGSHSTMRLLLTLFVLAAFSALFFAQSPTAPMHAVSTESAASGGCFSANVFLLEGRRLKNCFFNGLTRGR